MGRPTANDVAGAVAAVHRELEELSRAALKGRRHEEAKTLVAACFYLDAMERMSRDEAKADEKEAEQATAKEVA